MTEAAYRRAADGAVWDLGPGPARALARRDAGLKRALAAIDGPVARARPGGFEGLFRIVTEQQVSVESGKAVWRRCQEAVRPMAPAAYLALTSDQRRRLGLTRPKQSYVAAIAEAILSGALDLGALPGVDDEAAMEALQTVKGVGPWSAAIYLMFCEGRADIWPSGDVALMAAYQAAAELPERPASDAFDERAQTWRPYRGLAAHILWTYYAHLKGRVPG